MRSVELVFEGKPPRFPTRTNSSWGRFPTAVNRYVLHPQGYVFAISYAYHKLFILELPDAPGPDAKAPLATMASGLGFRDGLMNGPRAIATGLDGRVLILEGGQHRIQAFDIFGNPVPYFADPAAPKGKKIPTVKLKSGDGTKYRDLAVEAKGYFYVLRYSGDGGKPENYYIDLYDPEGNFLAETPEFAADKVVVNLIRNLFALNYEVILGKDKRPEPSVSLWTPPPPPKP